MSTTQITDGTSTVVASAALPTSSAVGLVVREAAQGQQIGANSRPVVIASDQLPFGSLVSTNNSSTATLGSNGVFTGAGEDVTQYMGAQVQVFSDKSSAAGGLSFQFSTDNTNWDFTDTNTITGGTAVTYQVRLRARYFRIVYTNGAIAQTAFRLQVIYKPTGETNFDPITDAVGTSDIGQITKSVLFAQNGSNFPNVQADASGNLRTSVGLVSTNNSSTTTLGSNGVFTGTGEDVTQYVAAEVQVFADQNSAAGGLSFQSSTDNSHWDTAENHTITANTGTSFQIRLRAQYFRIVYTNSTSVQTIFRLQIVYKTVSAQNAMPLSESLSSTSTAQIVKSISFAQNGSNFPFIQSDTSGNLINRPLSGVGPYQTAIGTISALNGTVSMQMAGMHGAGVQITGTWVGTLVPEISVDGGTTWQAIWFQDYFNLVLYFNVSTNATLSLTPTTGVAQVRIRASAWTSGTATINLTGTVSSTGAVVSVMGSGGQGGTIGSGQYPVTIGGQAASAMPTIAQNAQIQYAMFDRSGRFVTVTGGDRNILKNSGAVTLTTTTETTILSSQPGFFIDLLKVVISNPGTTKTEVEIRDSTGGTIQLHLVASTNTSFTLDFDPPLPQTAITNNWTAQLTTATTIYITLIGVVNQ